VHRGTGTSTVWRLYVQVVSKTPGRSPGTEATPGLFRTGNRSARVERENGRDYESIDFNLRSLVTFNARRS